MYYNYYTRSDISITSCIFVNQNMVIGRNENQQHFTVQQDMDTRPFLDASKEVPEQSQKSYIECDASGNLTYYHTLFTVPGQGNSGSCPGNPG